jgi:DNA polymerase-3 subunit epsilon
VADVLVGGLDIETTGLEQEKGHRIIEAAIAFYRVNTETFAYSKVGAWEQRINPQRPIDPKAQEVHGISFEELSDCPTWDMVAPKLSTLMDKAGTIVAHNGDGFDLPFITLEFIRIGCVLPEVNSIDTMLEGRWATPNGKLPNLRELCFATGIAYDPEKAHGALYDITVMMEAYFVGLKKGFFPLK